MNDNEREVFEWVDGYLDKVILSLDRDEDVVEDAIGYVIDGIKADIRRESDGRKAVEFRRRLDVKTQKDKHGKSI